MEDTQRPINAHQRLRDLVAKRMRYTNPAYGRAALFMGCGIQTGASGWHIEDHRGHRYVDFFDAYGNQAFGYGNPQITAAVRAQLDSGNTNSCKIFFDEGQAALSERLAELTGHALRYSFLTNGGAEAIDGALKLARAHTRRRKFVTAKNCYHGKTFAALSAAARPEYEALYKPLMPEFQAVPYGDLEAIERAIDQDTAAVLFETIQAEGGINPASAAYLQAVRRLCNERGALLILDEIQTGFGRTGRFFAFEHAGITPDVICIGKSFGGGMLPIAAILAKEEVWTAFTVAPMSFGSSLGGNPLACAVGLKTIELARDAAFLADVEAKGAFVATRLAALTAAYPELIAGHRGIGLFHGLELRDPGLAGLVLWLLFEQRIISAFCLFNPFVIRIEPPLIISQEALEHAMDGLATAMAQARTYVADLEAGSLGQSHFTVTEEIAATPDAVMALLGDAPRFYGLAPLVGDVQPGEAGQFHCRGVMDDIEIQWTERLEIDVAARRVTQRAHAGDFARFDRVTTVAPSPGHPARSQITMDVSWDAGTAEFERILSLRLRYSFERAVRQAMTRIAEGTRT
jgi:putrescine aminotransferase